MKFFLTRFFIKLTFLVFFNTFTMREILFRGWSKDSKKWVYGHIFKDRLEEYHLTHKGTDGNIHMFRVEKESIGQYTGLLYPNNEKIFEGDIVKDFLGNIKIVEYYKDGFWLNGVKKGADYNLRNLKSNIEQIGTVFGDKDMYLALF